MKKIYFLLFPFLGMLNYLYPHQQTFFLHHDQIVNFIKKYDPSFDLNEKITSLMTLSTQQLSSKSSQRHSIGDIACKEFDDIHERLTLIKNDLNNKPSFMQEINIDHYLRYNINPFSLIGFQSIKTNHQSTAEERQKYYTMIANQKIAHQTPQQPLYETEYSIKKSVNGDIFPSIIIEIIFMCITNHFTIDQQFSLMSSGYDIFNTRPYFMFALIVDSESNHYTLIPKFYRNYQSTNT